MSLFTHPYVLPKLSEFIQWNSKDDVLKNVLVLVHIDLHCKDKNYNGLPIMVWLPTLQRIFSFVP